MSFSSILSNMDKLASRLETTDPRSALALDMLSDQLESKIALFGIGKKPEGQYQKWYSSKGKRAWEVIKKKIIEENSGDGSFGEALHDVQTAYGEKEDGISEESMDAIKEAYDNVIEAYQKGNVPQNIRSELTRAYMEMSSGFKASEADGYQSRKASSDPIENLRKKIESIEEDVKQAKAFGYGGIDWEAYTKSWERALPGLKRELDLVSKNDGKGLRDLHAGERVALLGLGGGEKSKLEQWAKELGVKVRNIESGKEDGDVWYSVKFTSPIDEKKLGDSFTKKFPKWNHDCPNGKNGMTDSVRVFI